MARTRSMPRKAGAEKETQSSRLPTFQERLRRGSSIRGVKKLTLEELERLAQVMNERSGSCICVSEEVYRELEYGLRLVSGAVEDMAPITRKDFDTRLERLQNALAIAAQVLEPARLNAWVETTDSEFIFFLAEVVGRDGGVKEGLSLSQTHLRLLEAVRVHCARAGKTLAEMPAKTGRRSLDFYGPFVQLMAQTAGQLGIRVSTARDRLDDNSATPFTYFVHEVERFLPRAAWSNSLTACARRIERAFSSSGIPRQNSSKS